MDNKDLLLGAGIGIIISSVILYIGFFSYINSNNSPPTEITVDDNEIASRAKKLGMLYPSDIQPSTMSDDDIISKAEQLGMVFETTQQETESSSETESLEESTEAEIIKVQIPAGSSATKIAQILYDLKLVDSVNSFVQYVRQKNKLNYMKTGTFYVPLGSSNEEILNILTSRPKNNS